MAQPKVGTVEDGYYFKGGDPSVKDNWVEAPKLGAIQDGYVYKGGNPSKKDSWVEKNKISSNILDAGVSKLVKSATLGYSPDLYAGTQQGIENVKSFFSGNEAQDVYDKSRQEYDAYQNYLEAQYPIASTVGTIGGFIIPGAGAAKIVKAAKGALGLGKAALGAGLLSRGAQIAATGAAEGALVGGAHNVEPGQSRLDNTLVGAGAGALGNLAGVGISKAVGAGKKYIVSPIGERMGLMASPLKEGADDILMASERLGIEPTKGMLTGDPYIQKVESALSQRPTTPGVSMSKQNQQIFEGLKDAGEFAFKEADDALTPFQAGGTAKELVESGIESKLAKPIGIYNKIAKEVPLVDIDKKSTSRIANNILNLPYAKITGTGSQTLANQVADTLGKVKNVEDIRNLKTFVRQVMQDDTQESTKRFMATEIYGRLSRLEQNSITRAAISAADNPQHGRAVASQMIKEIKDANKVYGEVSGRLKELAKNIGLGRIDNYSEFIRKMGDIPDERFMDKVFNPKNVKALKQFKAEFPEAFDAMKKSKLAEMFVQSQTKGEISVSKLVQNAKKLSPEYKKMLFGDEAINALKDIETVHNSTYQKVGPSGTPEGIEYFQFNPLNPSDWYKELADRSKQYMLRATPAALQKFKATSGLLDRGLVNANKGGEMIRRSIPGSAIEFMNNK